MTSAGQLLEEAAALLILIYLVSALILRTRRPQTPVWAIMALASFAAVLAGLVPIDNVGRAIDLNVILFLVGMFSLVSLAESSGLLALAASRFISLFRNRGALVYLSAVLFGLLSAVAVNDTIALLGPPIAYSIARTARADPEAFFLLLAFSITIGSVTTPIGNPQNVLVAIQSGMKAPFVQFVTHLFLPTIANLILTAHVVKKIYRIGGGELELAATPREAITSRRDAILAAGGLTAAVASLVANDLLELLGGPHIEERGFIPFVIAAGVYVFSTNPRRVISSVDWGTIVFFITMFITMDGIWRSGILNPLLSAIMPHKLSGPWDTLSISVAALILSQALSNVPFTKLFIDYMKSLGYGAEDTSSWIALAMTSTIAGNLTLMGAASNIIILEALETRMGYTISFTRFLKIGSLVTSLNLTVYIACIELLKILSPSAE